MIIYGNMAEENRPLVAEQACDEEQPRRPAPEHGISKTRRALEGVIVTVTTVFCVATVMLSGFAAFYPHPEKLGFKYPTGNISAMHPTDITPASWVFYIWVLIYLWQMAWLVWAFTFPLFRPRAFRTIPVLVYLLFSIDCALNITWWYLWGNDIVVGALAVSILFALSLVLSVAVAVYKTPSLARNEVGLKGKLSRWATYVLVHNGLALFATWLCIAWLLNMSIVADAKNNFHGALSRDDAGTVALSLLTFEIIVWFLLEQTVLESYVRYIHIVYPCLIVVLAGVLVEHWSNGQEDSRNHIFALGVLVLVGVLQLARWAFTIIFYFVRKSREQAAP